GTNLITRTCTEPVPARDGQRIALRVTLDVDIDGVNRTRFYWAPTIAGPWQQLGEPVDGTPTSSIFNSTSPLEIGGHTSGTGALMAGYWFAAEVRNGINGTVVAALDFTAQTPGATNFTDSAGRSWSVTGDSEIVDVGDPDLVQFLSDHGVHIIPTSNPDGTANNDRENA